MQVRDVPPGSFRSIFKWGAPDVFYTVSDRLRAFVQERLQVPAVAPGPPHRPGLEQVEGLAPCGLSEQTLAALREVLAPEDVDTSDYSRALHGSGSTFLDLMNLRLGEVRHPPDVVVHPRDPEQVMAVVQLCHRERIPLIPAGARSSVTLGLAAPRGGVCLDLTRHMDRLLSVNAEDQTARVQAGMLGPAYEEALNAQGFTCGHFPQSFEFSTVGGWLAARGAGQQSTYFGKIEDIVVGLRCATPVGWLDTGAFPRAALGPDRTAMIVGSEGTLGVITEATLRIWPLRPKGQLPLSFMFRNLADGVATMRAWLQGGFGLPGVCRLSDAEETDVALQLDGLAGGRLDRWLQRLGYRPGERCLAIAATEGDRGAAALTAARGHAIAVRNGGLPLGSMPIDAWRKRRFHDPYVRDDLMDLGVLTDTLETAVPWSGLMHLWRSVRSVLKTRPNTVAMAHISHAYATGANLYFIFLSPLRRDDELNDYRAFHTRIVDAIIANGGSLSHHHGIGRLFAPWLPGHLGPASMAALRGLKAGLDPHGVLNPGALGLGLPEEPDSDSEE